MNYFDERGSQMNKSAVILLIFLCAVVALAGQHADDWIKYTSTAGRYSVMLPAQPTIDSQEASSAGGVKFTQYKATVVSSDVAYMIGYFDYTPGILSPSTRPGTG
jgi:hypothetical protein